MNTFKTLLALSIATLLFNSCNKQRFDPEISFPAAYIVNGGDNTISVIDLSDNTVKTKIELKRIDWPHHISLSPNSDKLAIGVPGMDLSGGHSGSGHNMGGGKIVIADAKTGKILEKVKLDEMNHNVAFSPDGSEVWTSQMTSPGKVLIFDTKKYKEQKSIDVGNMPAEVTFSKDGTMAFVANGGSNSVTAIRVSDKSIAATISVGENPVGAWTGSDNKMYVDNEMSETISVINVSSLSVEETIDLGFMPGMAAYNGQKNELWVTDATNGAVVYFVRTNNLWTKGGSIKTGAGAHAVVFSNDGLKAYITNQGADNVSVIDVSNRTVITSIPVGKKPNGLLLRH